MTAVTLSTPAFAYLLAVVSANNVVGLEAPDLFPASEDAQKETYQEGLDQLIADGHIQASEEEEGTYDFDPALYEMVAVIAAPELVIATFHSQAEEHHLLLNYLAEDHIVRLAALDGDEYSIGIVPELEKLTKQSSELLRLDESPEDHEFSVPMKLFEQMQDSGEAFSDELSGKLSEAEVADGHVLTLAEAFASEDQGEIVVASLEDGEVAHGRRAWIYGSDDNAWMFYLTSSGAQAVQCTNCGPSEIKDWILDSLDDLQT